MNTIGSSGDGTTRRSFEHGKLLALAFGIVLVLGLCGCGGSGSPTTPSTPTPQPVVSFAGTWSGTFTASSCGHTGGWPSCAGVFDGVQPLTLTLTQTGSSVSGTLRQSDVDMSVTGSVSADGHLLLNGTTTIPVTGLSITFALVGWDTQQSGNSLTGGWSDRLTAPGIPGFVQWINTINSAAKGAANQPVASSSEGWIQSQGRVEELLRLSHPGN